MNVQEKKSSPTAGGNIYWFNLLGKQYGHKKLRFNVPYDPVIPLFCHLPQSHKNYSQKASAVFSLLQYYSQ